MNNGHGGVVIGSEMSGGVRNVYAENCVMDSPELERALRIKTNPERGGFVENVYMRNVKIGQVADAVFKVNFLYGKVSEGDFIPWLRNVNLENVTSNKSKYGISIDAHRDSPATDITIKNCTFKNASKGNRFNNVKNVVFENVKINDEIFNKTINPTL
jgi:polygalacturonase